jgi:hypothetical protein
MFTMSLFTTFQENAMDDSVALAAAPSDLQRDHPAASPLDRVASAAEVPTSDQVGDLVGTTTGDVTPFKSESAQLAAPPAPSLAELRRVWGERIRREARLPGGVRERLAALVEQSAAVSDVDSQPQLLLDDVTTVLAHTLPGLLAPPLPTAAHPRGERFFTGERWGEQEAARLAREQLERTGFAETD